MKDKQGKQPGVSAAELIDALPFYVMLVDEHHHIVQANAAVRQQLGVDPGAIVGRYCPEAIHGISQPLNECPLEEALEKGQPVEREVFDETSGRWISSAVYPVPGRSTGDGRLFFHMLSDISARKRAEAELQASHATLREVCAHLESIREEERGRIAREIHDQLGQILTSLNIDLSWLAGRASKEPPAVLEKTQSMKESLGVALETVKTISAELRPPVLDTLGLAAALEWQGQELQRRTGVRFDCSARPDNIVLDSDCSIAIFRICQEAFTNIIRHAGATSVKVRLVRSKTKVTLSVQDNGKGIRPGEISDPKSFGLIGMRERARHWGGEILIEGGPGRGTLVRLTMPVARGGLASG